MAEPLPKSLAIVLVALTIGLGAVFVVNPIFPSHDGPHHVANCHMANHLSDRSLGYGEFLRPGGPPTYLGFHMLCLPLDELFGWKLGSAVTLFLISLSIALGYAYLSHALHGWSLSMTYGFSLAIPWSMYMGFFDFAFATGLSLWVLGYAVRPRASWVSSLAVSLGVLVVSFVHVTSAALLGLALAAVTVSTSRRKIRDLALLALMGLPTVAHVASSVLLYGDHPWPGGPETKATYFKPILLRFGDLVDTAAGAPRWLALFLLTPALLGALALRRKGTATPPHPGGRGLGAYGISALFLFLVSPFDLPMGNALWTFFAPRLSLLALLVLPTVGAPKKLARVHSVLSLLCSVVALVYATTLGVRLNRELGPAFAGLEAPIHRKGPRLPILLSRIDAPLPYVEPALNFGHYYLLAQGGVSPYLFAEWPVADSLLFVDSPRKLFGPHPPRNAYRGMDCQENIPGCPPLEERLEWLTIWGRSFEDLILYPASRAVRDKLSERHYQLDLDAGPLLIAHARPCTVAILAVPGLTPAAEPLRFELSRNILSDKVMSFLELPADAELDPAGESLEITGPDCGSVLIRLRARSWTCAEGAELAAAPRPDSPGHVTCTLTPSN
ncbi:MAG: hypothetical protein HY791_09305 [Deltaproteobacteria bacterium]|nr:hypothetical protein [Deltaproteobacteria bacterium]